MVFKKFYVFISDFLGELSANELLFLIIHLLKTVFQLFAGFRELKIRKFCSFRLFSYSIPNLREILN